MHHLKIEEVDKLFNKEERIWDTVQIQVVSNLFTYSSVWDRIEFERQENTILITGYIDKEEQEITFDLKKLDDIILTPLDVSILEFVFGKEKIIIESFKK